MMSQRGRERCPGMSVSGTWSGRGKAETYFPVLSPWTVWVKDVPLVVDITGVEELVEPVSGFAAVNHVPPHRVQLADALGELDMGGIV